jgi:DNA ligase (NAD+)
MEKLEYPIEALKEYFEKEDINVLFNLKIELDDKYYNTGETIIEDDKYDLLKDIIYKRDKKLISVGSKLRDGDNKVDLPFWLGSLNKITPEEPDVLKKWIKSNNVCQYVITEKLDGVSCLLECKDYNISLYTRGDGSVGSNISYLLPFFKNIPTELKNISVRGELIITKTIFDNKYKGIYKNPRNMVSGIINAKSHREGLEDIDFVAYEIIDNDTVPTISKQLYILGKMGFSTPKNLNMKSPTVDNLSEVLLEFKHTSKYEIDGIVVSSDNMYDRNIEGNPTYMFAFKMSIGDCVRQTTVRKIEWNVSKRGQLKPVVIVDPVEINGVTITRATGYHGKYIKDNNLGPGAVIKITRSKEVIPYIVEVVKQSKEVQMPDEYVWDKNKVNILSKNETDSHMSIKLISNFFGELGVKYVSEATVSKMYENGLDDIVKILGASKEKLLEIPEFKEKSVERIYNNIHNTLRDVKLSKILGASGVFGFGIGTKRIDSLLLHIPNLLEIYKTKTSEELLKMIMEVEGFSEIMATKIVTNINIADLLVKNISRYITIKEEVRVSNDMTGHKYVMSGFRDKELEEEIVKRGGKVTGTVSRNTTALIVKQKNENVTGKIENAQKLNIPIYSREEFKNLL